MTNTFSLIRELRHLRKIAGKRHPMYDQNKFAKYLIGFSIALGVTYLFLFGVLFIPMFKATFPSMEPYHILNKGMLYLLMVDFLMRFTMNKLPVQEIKPFVLLPMGKNRVLRSYLTLTGMSAYNLIWMFMLVPFGFGTLFRYFATQQLLVCAVPHADEPEHPLHLHARCRVCRTARRVAGA